MNGDDLIKQADIQRIAQEGTNIYNEIKVKYDPEHRGQFLAIDIDSKQAYLGNSSADAVALARSKHPNTVFYVVKIGYDVAETLAQSFAPTSR